MSAFTVLLVEPDPRLVPQVRESLTTGETSSEMRWVTNRDFAMQYLRREEGFSGAPRPDAILLTWNSSREAASLKGELDSDPKLRKIPVITLKAEAAEQEHKCHSRSRTALRNHKHHACTAA